MENRIYISQIDTKLGALKENFEKIRAQLAGVRGEGLVLFQQSAVMGYPLFNIKEKFPFLKKMEEDYIRELGNISKNPVLIGVSEGVYYIDNKKSELLLSGSSIKTGEKTFKIITKENFDFNDTEFGDDFDILILFISSISRAGSEFKKNQILSSLSKKIKKPLIYLNQTGSVDSLSYDGGSRVYNEKGEITACADFFNEDLMEVDLENPENNRISPYQAKFNQDKCEFSPDYSWDIERTYLSTIQTLKCYFRKNGLKKAVLGLSGGLDSSVCAALLSEALGCKNVTGISMPSVISSRESVSDAQKLAENLGINFKIIPIKDMVDVGLKAIGEAKFDMEKYEKSYTKDNIQARSRATILWGISNEFKGAIPIATCDKSEDYMGYSTTNGDMSGGFSPIGDVTKTKAFALARFINRNGEIIPNEIILKKPTAELEFDKDKGKFLYAEEALMPYEFLDEAIWHFENSNLNIKDMMKIDFVYEKKNKISPSQKQEWLQKFFKRMQGALFKWSITPNFPITDKHSLSSFESTHPISVKIPTDI